MFRKNISISSLHWILVDFQYSFKRIIYVPEQRNGHQNIVKRLEYSEFSTKYVLNIVTGNYISLWSWISSFHEKLLRPFMAWSITNNINTFLKNKKFLGVAMMNRELLLHFEVNTRPYNTVSFRGFIAEFCEHIVRLT